MQNRLKKSLSVFLSIVMVITSISVAFTISALAAPIDDLANALARIPAGEEKAFTVVSTHADNAGGTAIQEHKLRDDTSNGSIFDAAVAFAAYFQATAVTGSGTSGNANSPTWWTKLYNVTVADPRIAPYSALISAFCDNAATRGTPFKYDNVPNGKAGSVNENGLNVRVSLERTEFSVVEVYGTDIDSMPDSVVTNLNYGAAGKKGCTSSSSTGSKSDRYYYFDSKYATQTTNSNTLINKLKTISNYFTGSRLSQDPFAFDSNTISQEIVNNTSAFNALNTLSAQEKQTFFNAEHLDEIADYVELCEEAGSVILYGPDVEYFQNIEGFIAKINSSYYLGDLEEMDRLWTEQSVHYSRILTLTEKQKEDLIKHLDFDISAIEAARNTLYHDLRVAQLDVLKLALDSHYDNYHNAEENYRDLEDELLQYLQNDLTALLAQVSTFEAEYKNEVFTEGTSAYSNFITNLDYEIARREIVAIGSGHKIYYLELANKDYSNASSNSIISQIEEAEERFVTFEEDLAFAETELTEDDFENIYGGTLDEANAAIDRLYRILETRFTEQVSTAKAIYADYGEITWDNFTRLNGYYALIEHQVYNALASSDYIDSEIRADYFWLKDEVLDEYYNFIKDGGYENFVQLKLEPYPVRAAMLEDFARIVGYEVTEDRLLDVIRSLDQIITSDELADLAGLDVSSCIKGLTGCLCTDSTVNCLVDTLYVAVLEALEKAWGDLPTEFKDNDVDAKITVETLHSVLAKNTSTNTIKSLALYPDLLAAMLPNDFSDAKSALIDAVSGMDWVLTPTRKTSNAWEQLKDGNGKVNVDWGVDNPTNAAMQAMTKSERFRYAMSSALVGVLPLLSPLLLGQPLNVHADKVAKLDGKVKKIITISVKSDPVYLDLSATGNDGFAKVLTLVFEALLGEDIETIPTVAELRSFNQPVQLYDAIANPLNAFMDKLASKPLETFMEILPQLSYAMSFDVIAPLLNELTVFVKYTPDGEIDGIAGAACSHISKVADLSDSIGLNVGELLLGSDSSPIDLSCTRDFNAFIQMLPSCLAKGDSEDGCITLPEVNAGCLARLGEMDANAPTKRAAGFGVWKTDKVGNPTEMITPPVCSGTRHYIKADKAAVGYSILKYLLTSLRNEPSLLDSIMDLFKKDKKDDPDPDPDPGEPDPDPGEPVDPTCPWGDDCPLGDDCPCRNPGGAGITAAAHVMAFNAEGDDEGGSSGGLGGILDIILSEENEGNVIAALVELFSPTQYDKPEYNWREPADAEIPYLSYRNNWTKATGEYLYENLDDALGDILELLGQEGTLDDIINDALDGVFTQDTIKSITDALADIDSMLANLGDDFEDIADILLDVIEYLGVDLSAWNKYKTKPCPCVPQSEFYYYTFEDGDKDAFKAALYDIFAPLNPVLAFLLDGSNLEAFGGGLSFLGADGYADAIIPLLEALSCEGIMTTAEYKAAVEADSTALLSAIIEPVFAKLESLAAAPVKTVLDLIPNLLYFLASDGLTGFIGNLLHPLFVIIDTVRPIYSVELSLILDLLPDDFMPEGMNIEKLSDLTFGFLVDIIENAVGLDFNGPLTAVTDNLVGYATPFTSANGKDVYRVTEISGGDTITLLLSLVLAILDDDDNVEFLGDLIGEDILQTIKNILRLESFEADMLDINWIFTELAGTGETLNALNTSELFEGETGYGNLWTKAKAKWFDENIDTLIDNLIYLIGVDINGVRVEGMGDLLQAFVGTSLFTQDNAVALLEMLQGLIGEIESIPAGDLIKGILKEALGVDLDYWNTLDEDSFFVPNNDKDAFIDALTLILEPLNPVLGWLLSDKDFAFLADEHSEDYITLIGAEGYEFAIVPLLEAFECEGIVAPADFVADEDNMLRNILSPLLDKVDQILADPVQEILNLMPAISYFINSKGLDVVFKNLITPLRTVLSAIDPVAAVDLYEVIGFDLEAYDFESLIAFALDMVKDSTGFELTPVAMDAIAEMTLGVVVEKESLSRMNDYTRYTMEYAGASRADMITILSRLIIRFITEDGNPEAIKGILRESLNIDEASYAYVSALIDVLVGVLAHPHSMDTALGVIYQIANGLSIGTNEVRDVYDSVNSAWAAAFEYLKNSESEALQNFYKDASKFLDEYLPGLISPDGVFAPNGFIKFFESLMAFFQRIMDFFNNLFS